MHRWIDKLNELAERNEDCMVLTVARVRGSAPREVGAKMLVTATETIGTIGGGQLEYQCARTAFEQLKMAGVPDEARFVRRYPLGANCGQCCGGVVDVMYEYLSGMSAGFLTELQERHVQIRRFLAPPSVLGDDVAVLLVTCRGTVRNTCSICP